MKRLLLLIAMITCPDVLHASNCSFVTPPTDITITTAYSVFSSPSSTYSIPRNFSFKCTPNTTAVLKLSKGTNSAAFSPRTMRITNPPIGYAGTLMNYQLYTPAAQIWGDGTGGSTAVTFLSFPQDKTYDQTDGAVINAVVQGGLDVPPGTYSDTILATLSWGSSSTDTASFSVFVTVIPECTVSTFSLGFGTYDPIVTNLATPALANNPVIVNCTKSTAATIQLDPGQFSSGGSRRMRNTLGAFLPYDIYKDSGYATIWNTVNTNGATSGSKSTPLGGVIGYTAFGRILPNLDVSTGSYKDTVQAVVNFLP